MEFHERIVFRLIQTPCCGHNLCWVNPRLPTYCPECGRAMLVGIKHAIIFTDERAMLTYNEEK